MNDKEIRSLLSQIVPSIDWAAVRNDAVLEDIGLDSLDKANLIMELETKLNVKIPDDQYEKLVSIDDLIALNKQA